MREYEHLIQELDDQAGLRLWSPPSLWVAEEYEDGFPQFCIGWKTKRFCCDVDFYCALERLVKEMEEADWQEEANPLYHIECAKCGATSEPDPSQAAAKRKAEKAGWKGIVRKSESGVGGTVVNVCPKCAEKGSAQ